MNILLAFCFIILFLVAPITSEIIDGPANVRNAPQGEIMFVLNDSTSVEFLEFMDDWYHIGLVAYIDTNQVISLTHGANQNFIANGMANIKNSSDFVIGYLRDTIKYWYYEGVTESGTHEFILAGFTRIENIRPPSVVEIALDSLLGQGKLSLDDLGDHLAQFPYRHWFFDSYILYESWLIDISAEERIILFFNNDELFAVQYREDNTLINDKLFIKVSTLPNGRKLGYTAKIPEYKIKVLEDSLSFIIDRAD